MKKNDENNKFLETNFENINLKTVDLEFEVDPLIERNSARFDSEGINGLLMNCLIVNKFCFHKKFF